MADWIDSIASERAVGIKQPLSQDAHAAVNARYPGCTVETCWLCDQSTGRAGAGEDSIYDDDDRGPYCPECWAAHNGDDDT